MLQQQLIWTSSYLAPIFRTFPLPELIKGYNPLPHHHLPTPERQLVSSLRPHLTLLKAIKTPATDYQGERKIKFCSKLCYSRPH